MGFLEGYGMAGGLALGPNRFLLLLVEWYTADWLGFGFLAYTGCLFVCLLACLHEGERDVM